MDHEHYDRSYDYGNIVNISAYLNFIFDKISKLEALVNHLYNFSYNETADNPHRIISQVAPNLFSIRDQILIGQVVHVIPYYNWCLVTCADGGGIIPCVAVSQNNWGTIGPNAVHPYQHKSAVLVYKPSNLFFGFILGVIPKRVIDEHKNYLLINSKGRSSFHCDLINKLFIPSLDNVFNNELIYPKDVTTLTHGWITPTGVNLFINDYSIQLKASNFCGITAFLLDQLLRICGNNLLIHSLAYSLESYNDNGELFSKNYFCFYPWEAIGLRQPHNNIDDHPFISNNAPLDVDNYQKPSYWSLPNKKIKPIHRYEIFSGYISNGITESIVVPIDDRPYRLSEPNNINNICVFREHKDLSGSYSLLSAHSILLAKTTVLPQPEQIRDIADPLGDDINANNYKFSSLFGNGLDHNVSNLQFPGMYARSVMPLAIQEYLSYVTNWKTLHGFHYHKNDYFVPEFENLYEKVGIQPSHTKLNYSTLTNMPFLDDPIPTRITIDHRYSCDFYARTSFINLADNGDIIIGDGSGATIVMSGGNIRIEAPGGIYLCSGKEVIALTGQCVLRAHKSVDISSAHEDVRIKAENNLQLLGGNSGEGGVLIESKSSGLQQNYENKIGTEVDGRGIVLKAASGVLALYGSDIYMRSLTSDIVLDCANGNSNFELISNAVRVFYTSEVSFNYGDRTTDFNLKNSYYFGADQCIIPTTTVVDGSVYLLSQSGYDPILVVEGSVYVTQALAAGGQIADVDGGEIDQVPDNFVDNLKSSLQPYHNNLDSMKNIQKNKYNLLQNDYYTYSMPGNLDTIKSIGFSYRDTSNQYYSNSFIFTAPRWINNIISGSAQGGVLWNETPVMYQGQELYPWPGRDAWLGNTLLVYPEYKYYSIDDECPQQRYLHETSNEINNYQLVNMSQNYYSII